MFTKFHQRPAMLAQFYPATFRVNVKKLFHQPENLLPGGVCHGDLTRAYGREFPSPNPPLGGRG
jgi:hypothetical protein